MDLIVKVEWGERTDPTSKCEFLFDFVLFQCFSFDSSLYTGAVSHEKYAFFLIQRKPYNGIPSASEWMENRHKHILIITALKFKGVKGTDSATFRVTCLCAQLLIHCPVASVTVTHFQESSIHSSPQSTGCSRSQMKEDTV